MIENDHIFALVDCNNFYASCERIFNPKLEGKPVVILSNNDGCAVALSNEAKRLGMNVGTPIFQVKRLVDRHDVKVLSSNYALYGDISNRVMDVLSENSTETEIYSIDEAFLSLDGMKGNRAEYGRKLKRMVKKWTGIPVSIGIGRTKTLAKLANKIAKKRPEYCGVLDLTDRKDIDEFLKMVEAEDIWGIGPQKALKLNQFGIKTAFELKNMQDEWVRKNLGGVMSLRTVWELRGISCIPLELVRADKKEIISSRSFGKPVGTLQGLREAVTAYVARAAEKLRRQYSLAQGVTVFINTNYFKENEPQYHNSAYFMLPQPTAYTPDLVSHAVRLLEKIYKDGYLFKKAGIVLTDIVHQNKLQPDLFHDTDKEKKRADLMRAVDKINKKVKGTLQVASAGTYQPWQMRRKLLSPNYTTKWDEILEVKI